MLDALLPISSSGGEEPAVRIGERAPRLRVVARTGSERVVFERWRRETTGWSSTAGPLTLELLLIPDDDALRVEAVLQTRQSRALIDFEISVTDLPTLWTADAEPMALRVAYCGAHSRSEASRSFAAPVSAGDVDGWWVGAIAPPRGGPGLAFGALDFRRFATRTQATRDRLALRVELEGWRLEPGASLALPAFWLGATRGAPLFALESYASAVGAFHGAEPDESPCGWGSWGHFVERIDAGLMRETARALSGASSLRDVVQVIQIDDGWSELLETGRVSASWRPNRRFPSGIAPLAAEIARGGRACGLWLLPFTANSGSAIVDENPEFLVRDANGEPLHVGGGASFCVDPTHPGAREWLETVFSQVRDWGVDYLKLDFLRALMSPEPDGAADTFSTPRHYHDARTRVEAYRAGLELIRDVVGPDVFIVGCSAPAAPGAGLVSAHRVGPDIDPAWEGRLSGVRVAARALAANYFWQGRAWVNDPDYILPCETVETTRFWATAVALSGGSQILSADLAELAPWQEEMFTFVSPPTGRAARPLDLFDAAEPRVWQLAGADERQWQVVGLFNWDDRPREIPLDLPALGFTGDVHAWDAWRRSHRMLSGAVPYFVEGRSVKLLRLTPASGKKHPVLVGTDVHFSQGEWEIADERWDAGTRTLTIASSESLSRPGFAFIWCPDGLGPDDPALAWRPGLARVPLRPNSVLRVKFRDTSPRQD